MKLDSRLHAIDSELAQLRKDAARIDSRMKKLKTERRSLSMSDVSQAKRRAALIGAEYRAGTRKPPREYRDQYLANMTNAKLRRIIDGYERALDSKVWQMCWTRTRVQRRLNELYAELDARFP